MARQTSSVGKKCIPGLFCIENMTMFLLFVLLIVVIYLYYSQIAKTSELSKHASITQPIVVIPPVADVSPPVLFSISSRKYPL